MSYKIKRILVPLDGSRNSERGLDKAIYLAKKCGATIFGIHVIYTPKYGGFQRIYSLNGNFHDIKKRVEMMMKEARNVCENNSVMFKEKIKYGDVNDVLAKFANSPVNKIDLVVVGSRGKSSAREIFLGSTSNYILHKAKMPVVIVK